MKQVFFRILSVLLLLALLFATVGCSCADRGPAVMEYEGVRLTEDIYRYWLSCYKAQLSYELNEENRDEILALIHENIKKSLVCAGLFTRYGLQLSDSAREQINRAMEQLVSDLGDGDRAAFEAVTAQYGIGYDGLKIAFSYEQMAVSLREYLFGDNGRLSISRDNYEEYYQETYAHVYMIYIPLVDFVEDEDGIRLWDSEAQQYVYTEKTGEAWKTQMQKIEQIRAALSDPEAGEAAFRKLSETYNEDPSAESYPGGYYFSKEIDYADYVEQVTAQALTMTAGSFAEVRSDIGVHFLYRAASDEGAWEEEDNADFFDGFVDRVRDYYFEFTVAQETVNVAVYNDVMATVDFDAIPPNWEIYW